MFVAINNTDMGLSDIEKWIKIARDDNGGVISPESAMEVLSKTNHLGHIKKVLRNIKDKCTTPEEMVPYREFILSCVDSREMSGEAYQTLREMAKLCGCEDELETINKKPKLYNKTDCNFIVIKSKKEFYDIEDKNLRVFYDADNVDLSSCWLMGVKSLKFRKGVKVDLSYALDLPKDLDFSMCSEVGLTCCNLKGISLKFRDGAMVYLSKTTNLPKELDVSM